MSRPLTPSTSPDDLAVPIIQRTADEVKKVMKDEGSKPAAALLNEHSADWVKVRGTFTLEFVEYQNQKDKAATEVKLTLVGWQA